MPNPVSIHSLQFLYERDKGEHDILTDVLKVILLNETFYFDPAAHSTYTDISPYELTGQFGYVQKDKTLTNVGLTIEAGEDRVKATCSSPSWEAAGGNWEGIKACAIINETHANDTVVLCVDFDAIYIMEDGIPFQIDFSNGLYLARVIIPTTT